MFGHFTTLCMKGLSQQNSNIHTGNGSGHISQDKKFFPAVEFQSKYYVMKKTSLKSCQRNVRAPILQNICGRLILPMSNIKRTLAGNLNSTCFADDIENTGSSPSSFKVCNYVYKPRPFESLVKFFLKFKQKM